MATILLETRGRAPEKEIEQSILDIFSLLTKLQEKM